MDSELPLDRIAINYALKQNWKSALKANKEILNTTPDDTFALMRAARAYYELGKLESAKRLAKRTLKLDNENRIAERCLENWSKLENTTTNEPQQANPTAVRTISFFLEDPGRTKIVKLIHLGDNSLLASIQCGQEVAMMPQNRKMVVSTLSGSYIGRLHDDISARLCEALRVGGVYASFIKSLDVNEVKVFIKETKGDRVFSKPL